MDNASSSAAQDNVLEENTSEIIERQEEAQDIVILANSDSSSSFIGIEEEIDPITKAIRQEILLKQRNILKAYITENFDSTVDKHDNQEFVNYLKNVNNQVIINQVFLAPKVKSELEKVEIEGYQKVHHNFADRFQAINWQDGNKQENVRIQFVKNNVGDQLATLKETTHKSKELVSLADGTGKQINSYRTIDLPIELESKSGPMHLSLVVQDTNGKNITKDKAVYFTAHYDRQGKLLEMSSPKPVKFNGEGDEAVGYIEHQGNIYTLPVTQGKYREMLLALEKNKGQEINLSQISATAQDQVVTANKISNINNISLQIPKQDKLQYHQEQKKEAEGILQQTSEYYKLLKANAELIVDGLELTKKKNDTGNRLLLEEVAAQFQDIHDLFPSQAISQYQTILDKLPPATKFRDQEGESLQQLAQKNPTLAEKVVEEHLVTHEAEYKKLPTTNPISKVLQWFKQIGTVSSSNEKLSTSGIDQHLFKVNKIKDKATKMAYEVEQAMTQVKAADQAWHEEIKKIQILAANLPEDNSNKEKLTKFVKVLLEQEEEIKTGTPLPQSKERDEALAKKADYESKQKNQIIDNNTSNISATNNNINHEEHIDNNFCQIKTNQMITRFMDQGYLPYGEKATDKTSNDCKVNSNTDIILPPLTASKTQTHKTQVNKR